MLRDAARDEQLERRAGAFVNFGARHDRVAHALEPRARHQLRELGRGEAEPDVGLLLAEPIVTVADEIDHDDGAARLDDPRHLAERGDRARGVVEDERGERGVDARVGEGEVLELAALEGHVREAELLRLRARALQHLGRQIDRDDARRDLREVGEHAPGAGADVGDDEPARYEREERREARAAGEELAAERVPVFGLVEERFALRAAAGEDLLDARGELSLFRDAAELFAERAVEERLVRRDAVERGGALLADGEEPRLRERLEVTGHARLRRLNDLGELSYRQLFVEERGEEDDARLLGERLESIEPAVHSVGVSRFMRSCKRMHEC